MTQPIVPLHKLIPYRNPREHDGDFRTRKPRLSLAAKTLGHRRAI